MTRRALMVTPLYTLTDDQDASAAVKQTPQDTWARGFGSLLDRVARTVDREGVLLLDRAAAHALKLPASPEESLTVGLDDARASGWLHGSLFPFTAFYGDGRPTIVVGLTSWSDIDRSPLIDLRSQLDSVDRLALWHELTGYAWRGTPGVAAMTIMRGTLPDFTIRGNKVKPSLRYPTGPDGASEVDYQPTDWSRAQTLQYAHGYDATRMYLAAAGSCEHFAPWTLRHTGRIGFNPKLAGWWLVKLGPWSHPLIPAPAGPGESERWVTTPTLQLLTELMDKGEHFQDFEVIDSYTGDGKRLLREYAQTLEGTYQAARDRVEAAGTDSSASAVMEAVKLAYKEGNGLLNYTNPDSGQPNSIYRPDWHFAVIAQARTNLWRRLWKVGQEEGRWPLEIKVDHVWYESSDPDPLASKPAGIPLVNAKGRTDALGTFKTKGTREKGHAR